MTGYRMIPGTSSAKQNEKSIVHGPKIVIALLDFKATEKGDLSLEKNSEYEVIDYSHEHWWKVHDYAGNMGYIPSNYVKQKELQQYDWYVNLSRQRTEILLKQEDKDGCFVVRNSSRKSVYTLSLYTKFPKPHVKHYHIKQNSNGEFYLSEKHCSSTIPNLINYHQHNIGGLSTQLGTSPSDTMCLTYDEWEIDPHKIMLSNEIGSGNFGVVWQGKLYGHKDVAVKMMKEGSMSDDDFIAEAKVMTKLKHPNLVQLYGVCSKNRPFLIVTEFMTHGSLLGYLKSHVGSLINKQSELLDMCIQICKGMAYLERHSYIHRDLAARNCLIGLDNIVKVADFGLAKYVLEGQYRESRKSKIAIKWLSPEVLIDKIFSSKSDIWAYGVLMWEVFTCGDEPYGSLENSEAAKIVKNGTVLEKPKECSAEVYDLMLKCWCKLPDERPTFRNLKEQMLKMSQSLAY